LHEDTDYPVALRSIPDRRPIFLCVAPLKHKTKSRSRLSARAIPRNTGAAWPKNSPPTWTVRGVTVVSGLARGVDTAAHRGTLEAGGRTFAVCGCGLDITYPSENKPLLERVATSGAAFSEFAPTVHPEAWHFPARNRIISGLSAGTIVVEAGERSGALITADFAMGQGREVFAVPENIHKIQSRGAHALIKQGATLVESADDVLEALNNRAVPFQRELPFREKPNARAQNVERRASVPKSLHVRPDLSPSENRVYLALDLEPRHLDDIAATAEMGAAEASATLVVLEIKGIARAWRADYLQGRPNEYSACSTSIKARRRHIWC
jgi:DNA processing protein